MGQTVPLHIVLVLIYTYVTVNSPTIKRQITLSKLYIYTLETRASNSGISPTTKFTPPSLTIPTTVTIQFNGMKKDEPLPRTVATPCLSNAASLNSVNHACSPNTCVYQKAANESKYPEGPREDGMSPWAFSIAAPICSMTLEGM
jgi:hypothetical protein